MERPDPAKVIAGGPNLAHHVGIVRGFGVPVVVAINRFPTDSPEEVAVAQKIGLDAGASDAVEFSGFADGGDGATALAEAVVRAAKDGPVEPVYAYPLEAKVEDKVLALARKIYGADDVAWPPEARRRLRRFEEQGWGGLPICMAKTHLSISHDPALRGRPSGYTFAVSDIRASVGAGFLYPLAGHMETLPGLPTRPRALDMDVTPSGEIVGLG
jgi:formyltetrahydrofolate synthetase